MPKLNTTAEKKPCPLCGRGYTYPGLIAHVAFKHPDAPAIASDVAHVAEDITAKLAERDAQLAEKDTRLAELVKLQEDTVSRIAELEAMLAEAPQSIADFPGEVQAEHFRTVWQQANDKDKARLAEAWGIPLTTTAPTLEPKAKVAESRRVLPGHVILTIGGRPAHVIVSRG